MAVPFAFALFLFAQFATFALFLVLFVFPLLLGDGAGVFGVALGLFAFARVFLRGSFARPKPVFLFAGLAFLRAERVFFGPDLFPFGLALLGRRDAAFSGFSAQAFAATAFVGMTFVAGAGRAFALGVAAFVM